MTNKLSDLNNHLFAQLDRMAVSDMTPEQIEQEVKRSEAIVAVAGQVTRNADLQLKAEQRAEAAETLNAEMLAVLESIVVDDTWGLEHKVYMNCRSVIAKAKATQ